MGKNVLLFLSFFLFLVVAIVLICYWEGKRLPQKAACEHLAKSLSNGRYGSIVINHTWYAGCEVKDGKIVYFIKKKFP